MLTLLLVVGAVTCSPVPSDLPALTAHDAAHAIEVTHEVRHVTFEVSEEVSSEATASSQVPSSSSFSSSSSSSSSSGEPPEDDPPIPTATTPPTSPEAHSRLETPAEHVHSTHHPEGVQSIGQHPRGPESTEGHHPGSVESTHSQPGEPQSTESHPDDSQSTEDPVEEPQSTESHPDDSQSAEDHVEDPQPTESHPQDPQSTESHPQDPQSTESHPQDPQSTESHPQDPQSTESHPQDPQSTESHPKDPQSTESHPQDPQSTESHPQDPQSTESHPQDPQSTESRPQDPQSTESHPEHPETSQNQPDVEFKEVQADEVAEVSVEEGEVHSNQESSPEQNTDTTTETPAGMITDEEAQVTVDHFVLGKGTDETNVAVRGEIGQLSGLPEASAGDANEDRVDGAHEALAEEVHYELEHMVESEVEKQVPEQLEKLSQIKEDAGVSEGVEEAAEGTEEHEGLAEHAPGELKDMTPRIIEPVKDLDSEESEEQVEKKSEEVVPSFVLESSVPIGIVERSDAGDVILHETEPVAVAETAPQETRVLPPEGIAAEAIRKSRVYIQDPREDSEEMTQAEKPTMLDKVESYVNHVPKLSESGLEIMSMTSPTPDAPPEGAPTDELETEREESPPASEEVDALAVSTEDDLEENNSTVVEVPISSEAEADEVGVIPEVVPEAVPETALEGESEIAVEAEPEGELEAVPEVIPHVPDTHDPPSPSSAPLPKEEYTDNYGDPLISGDLPDFDVTKEELPSEEHPLPEVPAELPTHPQDQSEKGNGEESSDLTAGEHTLEVEDGAPWELPPQQEKVSAVAPAALTPGCIVGIVFGVILSLVILLGVGGFVVWQRRTLNRPKVLGSDRGYAGSDSGGYIDDQVRVSYVNSQIDTPKGSPEDLISLDNDSFLNSLESMTIQNLWTDNIRHTKL